MNTHSPALLALLQKLPLLGLTDEQVDLNTKADGEFLVVLNFSPTNSVEITVGEFWRYPGVSCYFVNFHHVAGNMMACPGTPHIERALFDIGCCTALFVHPSA